MQDCPKTVDNAPTIKAFMQHLESGNAGLITCSKESVRTQRKVLD